MFVRNTLKIMCKLFINNNVYINPQDYFLKSLNYSLPFLDTKFSKTSSSYEINHIIEPIGIFKIQSTRLPQITRNIGIII